MLTLETQPRGAATVVKAAGDLDLATADRLRETLEALIAGRYTRLVVDLTEVPFVDSTGLGALVSGLRASARAGGSLKLAAPGEAVMRVLTLTRMDRLFDVCDSVDDALRRFARDAGPET